jgi:poly(A) polymerase
MNEKRSSHDDALAVVHRLRSAGHEAYFAGGCVRDALLGLEPKDYDVATDAPPGKVRELFPRTQAVGAAFGVILVRKGKSQVEVATFRTDLKYSDGRRPEGVVFTTAEEDAKRRDFTINGLFFDPVDEKVIDFVGGQDDLQNKVLRAIGNPDERFAEDHLRLLRAVRFAARFALTIEPNTDGAIARNAPHLARIAPERIADELRAMLTPVTRNAAWQMMRRYGLDAVVFRFRNSIGATATTAGVFERVSPGQPIPFGLALAAAAVSSQESGAFPDLSARETAHAMRQSLRVSNDEAEMIEDTLADVELLIRNPQARVAVLKRFLARPNSSHARTLLAALPAELAGNRDALEQRLRDLEKTDYAPPPLVTGDDLTAAGLNPGKVFKRALDEAYDAQLEDRVTTRDQALQLALGIARAG